MILDTIHSTLHLRHFCVSILHSTNTCRYTIIECDPCFFEHCEQTIEFSRRIEI